jgi:hypothetical protein
MKKGVSMSRKFIFFLIGLIAFLNFSTISGAQPVVYGAYGNGCYYNNGDYCNDGGVYLFGGGYDNRRDVHNYSHRGFESRGRAHSGGGRGGRR